MYVAITCCIMICSTSKGFVTYHGSMECEINVKCRNTYSCNSQITKAALGQKADQEGSHH